MYCLPCSTYSFAFCLPCSTSSAAFSFASRAVFAMSSRVSLPAFGAYSTPSRAPIPSPARNHPSPLAPPSLSAIVFSCLNRLVWRKLSLSRKYEFLWNVPPVPPSVRFARSRQRDGSPLTYPLGQMPRLRFRLRLAGSPRPAFPREAYDSTFRPFLDGNTSNRQDETVRPGADGRELDEPPEDWFQVTAAPSRRTYLL